MAGKYVTGPMTIKEFEERRKNQYVTGPTTIGDFESSYRAYKNEEKQKQDAWDKYLRSYVNNVQYRNTMGAAQPFNRQQGPTVETHPYVYEPSKIETTWTQGNRTYNNSGRGPVTSQGRVGSASMSTEYGGRPKTPSLSELEQQIAELTEQAKNAQDRAWSIDRNLDPMGASAALQEFRNLDKQIKELEKQRDELAAANNSWMQNPEPAPAAQAGNKLDPDIAAAEEEIVIGEPVQIDPTKPMDPVMEKENQITALKSEIAALSDQGAAILNNPDNMNMATAGYASAGEQFNAIRVQVEEKQRQLEQEQKELEQLQRDQKLQNNKIYQDIIGKPGGKTDGNGKITIGGGEQPLSIYDQYEYGKPEERGDIADDVLGYGKYNKHINDNYLQEYGILAEEEAWKQVKDSADKNMGLAKDAILGTYNESDPEFTNPIYQQMIDRVPELVKNPVRTVENDEILFNAMLTGIGSYEDLKDDQDVREKLDQYWDILTNGTAQKLQDLETLRGEAEAAYGYEKTAARVAEQNLEKIETKKDELLEYSEINDQYDDNLEYATAKLDTDKGTTNPNEIRDEALGRNLNVNITNDINRIASFIDGGAEMTSFCNALYDGKEPKVTASYNYAMMLTDEEKNIFLSNYKKAVLEGKEPTEAKAYLEALQPYLRARYSDAEKIGFSEVARNYPVVASMADLVGKMASPYVDIARNIMHDWFGDKSAEDPNSDWYFWQRLGNQSEATISKDLSERYGNIVGKAYTNFMNSASNFLRAVTGPKGSGAANMIAGLGQFFFQVHQESTYRYLDEGFKYNEANARATADGVQEVAEELLPYETMLGSGGHNVGLSMFIQAANEFLQEFTGATLGEKIKGIFFGDSEQQRADDIIAKQGYYNNKGEWVDLSNLGKQELTDYAKFQANKEFWDQAWEQGLGGALGGWLGGTYGKTIETISTIRSGSKINNPTNNFEGKTGSDLLVDTALGMKGTESERLARDIDEKRKKGKKSSNYETGRLAATMAEETNEQVGQVAGDTLKNRIKKQLTDAGVAPERADGLADVMAQGLMNQGKLSILDRHKIAKEHAAIDLWGSYTSNNGLNANAMGAQAEISEATKEQQSVAQVLRNVTGEGTAEANSAVADEVNRSNRKGSAEEAVEDLSIRRPDLITPEYAEAAKAEAGNSKNNSKTFLDDAVKIRLAAFGLNTMPKTGMDQESAQRLWDAAKAEFNAADAQRIKAQQKLNPGNGAVDYEGAALGTKEFKKKLSGLSRSMRRQVLATAWIAKTLGHTVHFEYNDAVTRDANGREIRNESYIHGWENGGDGSVTINVAGALLSGRSKNMLATLPHEFTHWLEQNSKEGYAQLRQFIVDNLRAKGMNVEARMVQIMENENSILGPDSKKQQTLNGAMAEIVAQGCEAIFESPEMLSRLANEKPTVYAKFRAFLQKLMDELTTGMDESLSEEARLLRDVKDEIAKRWLSARDEALGRESEGTGNIVVIDGEQFSVAYMKSLSWEEQVDKIENKKARRNDIMVIAKEGEMSRYGIDGMILLTQKDYHKARREKEEGKSASAHGLSVPEMKSLKQSMLDPVAKITTERGTVIVTGQKDNNGEGNYIIVPIVKNKNDAGETVWTATTVHGRVVMPGLYSNWDDEGNYTPKQNTKIYLYKENAKDVLITGSKSSGADQKIISVIDTLTQDAEENKNFSVAYPEEEIKKSERYTRIPETGLRTSKAIDTGNMEGHPSNLLPDTNIISDIRNEVNSDEEYRKAVERGDIRAATAMLMDKLKRTEGIIPIITPHWDAGRNAKLARLIKNKETGAIAEAAADLAQYVPDNAVLIPMPPHEGKVTDETDTALLAKAISELTGRPVVNALEGENRESRYKAKSENRKGASQSELGLRQVKEIPEGTFPIFIDNIVGSGITADAAREAMDGGITLALTKAIRSPGIRGHKNAKITYDRNDNLIPLSERFNIDIRDVNFSMAQPVEVNKDGLIAVHNLGEEQLMAALQLGGFPMPSIAVIRTNYAHTRYGDISVVFYPRAIDPKTSKNNKVYSGDAWTPTYPSIEYKLNNKVLEKALKGIDKILPEGLIGLNGADLYETNLTKDVNSYRGDYVKALKNSIKLKAAYLTEKGVQIPVKENSVSSRFSNENLRKVISALGEKTIYDAMMNGTEYLDNHPEISETVRKIMEDSWLKEIQEKISDKEKLPRLARMTPYSEDKWGFSHISDALNGAYRIASSGIRSEVDSKALREMFDNQIDNADYEDWIRDKFSGIIEKSGIRNNKDYYTNSGNARSWEALHDEETLENVVRIMKSEADKGANAFFSQSEMLAIGTKNFTSLADIRAHKDQLQHLTDEEISALKQDIVNGFSQLMDEMYDKKESNIFIARDRALQAMVQAVRKSKKAAGIMRELKQWYGLNITDDMGQRIEDLVKRIEELPTEYFEAKPQRAVNFDEIAKVIVPEGTNKQLLNMLDLYGVPYETYNGTDEGRLEALNNQEDAQFSVMQPNMDVRSFMMGLNEASLESFQEKAMLRQFKEMNMARDIANMELIQYRNKLRELEAKENPSAYDREEMRKARNRITNAENKLEKAELALDKATQDKGFANLMHKNERLMKGLVGGRTIEDVQKVIQALTDQVTEMSAEMEKRQKKIDQMRKDLTQRKLEALVNENSARRMAGIIKQEYSSDMDTGELVKALTEIRLKIQGKENIDQDVEDLAWRIAQGTRGEESAVINALRGRTIVLGPSQMAELKGQHRTIRDVRSALAGTGIKVTTGNTNTLDSVWSQICLMAASLDPNTNSGDQLDALLSLIRAERRAQSNADMFKDQRNMDNVKQELKAMIAAVDMNVPKDPAAVEIINRMNRLMKEMETGTEESAEELRKARSDLAEIVDAGNMVINATDAVQRDIKASIQYNNALAEQSEAALWKNEKFKIIQQLKDKNTEALIKEQQKWRDRIAKDKTVREKMNENMHIRKQIHRNITRMKKLIINETDLENVPEHMKSLAREVLDLIVANDLGAQKITGIAREDLKEMQRVLGIMDARDGRFTENDLRVLNDEEVQSVIMDALADIEDGITLYNSSTKGRGILENLDMFHTALESVLDGVAKIKGIIDREREISIGDRQILVADAAGAVAMDAKGSKFKGELKGRGSKQLNAVRRAVIFGNLTPVYFFKQLKNRGMDMQWDELRRAENRNGLELQKAAAKIAEIAEKYHYKDWADQKTTVSVNGQTIEITMQQIMSLYAIYRREQTLNPEESEHLKGGGVYFEEPDANTEGKLRREKWQSKPVKMNDEMVRALAGKLSKDQMGYLEEIVGYLSNDMSKLGNEASMRMYGIEKYKEDWYFPMMIWDGVKSARSDKGISGTNENRAAHKGWSKRRKHQAVNALVIKDFTDVAVGHIVEMINYNTVAPAIENINKVLNYQFKEPGDETGTVRRNTRIIFQQAYGKDALNYLETFMKDLNGGTVQDQRKTLREAALSMFKKNAVAGSLSVAMQQPLSYIRAAMMISPTALAQALSPEYWKGSYAEMMKYSGVAVIKNMGRFDMNFGRSARDFIAPEKNETILAKATDKLTAAPEAMDRMTWTRMWSACKIEQHKKNPGMDMQSEEFLTKVAERFNDVMQQTQVYDSVMVKSQNMRSDKFTMKMLTSFMAEPTLSLNVLADAVQNFNTKGGKAIAGKAAATFLLSAIMQALVKGLMGSGRTPDDKKTMEENFLYKWYSAFLNEANPLSLVPGYSDIVELIKNGELNDDAMGAIGKIFTTIDTAAKAIGGNGKGWYRDIEDTAGQLAQLFTNVPVKNLMRDGRAMYNFITQEPYAKRESSGAVKRQQATAAFWNADSLIGAINTKLGEAGFKTSNTAYYGRLFDAIQSGNKAEEQDIREYLTLGKGVSEKSIETGLKSQAKKHAGEMSRGEYEKMLKAANPNLSDDDVFWQADAMEYQKEKGLDEKPSGKYYRLWDAMDSNSAANITSAITTMTKHGVEAKNIKSQITSHYKQAYLDGDSTTKRTIRDAMQKAYKKLGATAEDANKIIDKWKPASNSSGSLPVRSMPAGDQMTTSVRQKRIIGSKDQPAEIKKYGEGLGKINTEKEDMTGAFDYMNNIATGAEYKTSEETYQELVSYENGLSKKKDLTKIPLETMLNEISQITGDDNGEYLTEEASDYIMEQYENDTIDSVTANDLVQHLKETGSKLFEEKTPDDFKPREIKTDSNPKTWTGEEFEEGIEYTKGREWMNLQQQEKILQDAPEQAKSMTLSKLMSNVKRITNNNNPIIYFSSKTIEFLLKASGKMDQYTAEDLIRYLDGEKMFAK